MILITEVCKEHLAEEYGADIASSMSEPFYYKKIKYTDKKGKKKTERDKSAAPVLYAKRIYSDKTVAFCNSCSQKEPLIDSSIRSTMLYVTGFVG